jgi:hypothetical protein
VRKRIIWYITSFKSVQFKTVHRPKKSKREFALAYTRHSGIVTSTPYYATASAQLEYNKNIIWNNTEDITKWNGNDRRLGIRFYFLTPDMPQMFYTRTHTCYTIQAARYRWPGSPLQSAPLAARFPCNHTVAAVVSRRRRETHPLWDSWPVVDNLILRPMIMPATRFEPTTATWQAATLPLHQLPSATNEHCDVTWRDENSRAGVELDSLTVLR